MKAKRSNKGMDRATRLAQQRFLRQQEEKVRELEPLGKSQASQFVETMRELDRKVAECLHVPVRLLAYRLGETGAAVARPTSDVTLDEVRQELQRLAQPAAEETGMFRFAGLDFSPLETPQSFFGMGFAALPVTASQSCRVCGCTDHQACMTEDGPCCWVEPGLCSGCATGGDDDD